MKNLPRSRLSLLVKNIPELGTGTEHIAVRTLYRTSLRMWKQTRSWNNNKYSTKSRISFVDPKKTYRTRTWIMPVKSAISKKELPTQKIIFWTHRPPVRSGKAATLDKKIRYNSELRRNIQCICRNLDYSYKRSLTEATNIIPDDDRRSTTGGLGNSHKTSVSLSWSIIPFLTTTYTFLYNPVTRSRVEYFNNRTKLS